MGHTLLALPFTVQVPQHHTITRPELPYDLHMTTHDSEFNHNFHWLMYFVCIDSSKINPYCVYRRIINEVAMYLTLKESALETSVAND